jgi:hypothetical protein
MQLRKGGPPVVVGEFCVPGDEAGLGEVVDGFDVDFLWRKPETDIDINIDINANINTENTHPSQRRRRMGHPQRLGQESEEWLSGTICAGCAVNCGENHECTSRKGGPPASGERQDTILRGHRRRWSQYKEHAHYWQ